MSYSEKWDKKNQEFITLPKKSLKIMGLMALAIGSLGTVGVIFTMFPSCLGF